MFIAFKSAQPILKTNRYTKQNETVPSHPLISFKLYIRRNKRKQLCRRNHHYFSGQAVQRQKSLQPQNPRMLFLCRQKKPSKKNLPEDRTSYKWLGNTFALRTSFGSYDSYTTFADRTHKPHTLSSVIATDSKTQCAVTADNKGVSFYSLFRDKPVKFIAANDKNSAFPKMLPRWNPSSRQSSKARKST